MQPTHPIAGLSSRLPFFFPSRGQKLLGKLCEQNKVLREQERLVQQLRAEKVRGGQLQQMNVAARRWPCPGGTFMVTK